MSNLKCTRIPTTGAIAGLEPTDYIPLDTVQSGEPKERGCSLYADQTNQLDAGVWECEPNKHVIEAAPYDEFVYLLQGHIDVIDDEGGVESYKAGDSFMMPRGCKCTWDVKEPVRKLYVVLTAESYQG
ncbi:MAG: cupin domain-containing protein [Aestuariivirgaceae bacterium]